MSHGGARNRSGPPPKPDSARSEHRGFWLTALPAAGYKGRVPAFPLPDQTKRETQVWREAWRTPQACAWSMPSEHWRWRTVAMWVRLAVRCEDPTVSPPTLAQMHRLADQIGLTTAGLAELGWRVSREADGEPTPEPTSEKASAPASRPVGERRLRAVANG